MFLFLFLIKKEDSHRKSVRVLNKILNKESICFISDFFLNEVLNVLADKKEIPKSKIDPFLYEFYSMPNVLESSIRFFNFETFLALKKKYKVKMFNDAMLIFLSEMSNIPIITNDYEDFKLFKKNQPHLIYFLDELEL